MNKIYKTVWNETTRTWVAVPEFAPAQGKSSNGGVSVSSVAGGNAVSRFGFKMLAISASVAIPSISQVAMAADARISNGSAQGTVAISPSGSDVGGNGSAKATGKTSIAAGWNAKADGENSIALGYGASTETNSATYYRIQNVPDKTMNNIAIGKQARSGGLQTIAFGPESVASKSQSIAFGFDAQATGDQSVALGANTRSVGDSSIAIGGDDLDSVASTVYRMTSPSADNDAYNDTALAKQYRTLTGQNLVNFTPGNRYIGTSTGQAGVAVGVSAKAADLATAVGTKSHATGDYSVALGVGANTELANAIALGAGSTTKTNATNVASATVGSVTYGGPAKPFAGSGNVVAGDQVSVGAAGFERQIKHVAPGEITATSTDAINGSQLYQITDGLQKSIANIPSNNTHFYSVQGASGDNNYNNDGAVANKSMAVGNGAKAQGVSSVAIGNATVAKASASNSVSEGAVAIGDTSYAAGHHALALGQSRAEEHNAVAAGSNARAAATSSIAVGTSAVASDAHTIAIGSAANSAAANGIAIGRDSATTMSAPGSVALGYGSQATRRAIVAGSVATSTTPTVAANQVFALDASSDTDKANIRETVKGGSGAVSVGTQNDTRQIINVAAGTEDADAVNVAQLKSVANLIKNNTPTKVGPATGSPVKVENKGSASAPNYELDLTDAAKGSLKKADTAMQTFKVASTPSKGGTATAGSDVANGETLLFKAGDNVSISQSGKEITINATGASSKVEALSGSPITVSGDGSTANPYKVGAATTSLVVGSRGSITAPAAADAGKLVNAGDLAAAINNSGFIATSAKTGSGQVSGSSEKLVKPGDTLKLTAGNGIKIAQQDGEFTISGTDTGSATLPNLKLTGNTGTAETDNIDPAQPYNIKGSDGNILTAVENQGIGFKLADTVKIGPAAGGNQITINGTDGNISGLKDNLPTPAAANQAAPANLTAIGNRAATVNDVLNAGWNLKAGGADKDFVKPYDTVDFVNGNATVAKVESDGSTSKVSYDVNVDGSTIKVDANGKLYATAAAASVPNIKLEGNSGTGETNNIDPTLPYTIKGTDGNVLTTVANQGIGFALNNIVNIGPATGGNRVTINGNAGTIGGLTNKTFDVNNIVSGQAATEDQLKAVAQQVARPSSFTLTAQGANGSTVTGGATVDLRSTDNNITVSKDATDNTVKFALAKNLTADSLTTGNTKVDNAGVTVNGGANGPVSLTNSGLNNGGNTITNVADGVNDTDAVNVRQLRNAQGSLTNVTNIIGTTAPNLVTYNVHGNEAKTDNTIVSAINNMNTGGIKFFHVNDGTGNQNTAGMTSHPEDSSAAGNYGAAVGYQAKADGENAIAFGKGAQASGANSISIGTGNQVSGSRSGAIGDPSVVTGNDAYSIGNNNVISTNNTFALGSNISTTSANSVFLGDNSASFTQNGSGNNGVHTAVSGSSNYTYKGENDANVAGVNNAAGVVSVGNATSTRQIQGVAAGVIAADSTDAVNGSQLYYTNQAIESVKNGGAGIVQYSNANNPTQGGGAPSNNVTLVGADTNAPVTLHNVAPGVQGTDAVNVNQLNQVNNRINKVADDADAGTAAAMATAGLPQAYLPGKSMVAVAGSTYRGKQGYAVGFSAITDSGNWIIKGSASGNSKGRFGATVGAGYQW